MLGLRNNAGFAVGPGPAMNGYVIFNFQRGGDFVSFYIPRAHDAGRGRGTVGEFFESLKSKGQRPKSA